MILVLSSSFFIYSKQNNQNKFTLNTYFNTFAPILEYNLRSIIKPGQRRVGYRHLSNFNYKYLKLMKPGKCPCSETPKQSSRQRRVSICYTHFRN